MTREIKFRAWDTVFKQTVEVVNVKNGFRKLEDYQITISQLFDEDVENKYIPLQFTGLKDKNGKEIYEGDILESEYESVGIPKEKNCHPVIWKNGSWKVDHNINDCCKPWRGDLNSHHLSEIIIGNIYQNPELLK